MSRYRFNILINQYACLELGITNLTQAAILDLVINASAWAEPVVIENQVYYWTSRSMICAELPLADIKPDTAYRYLCHLAELGLIEYRKEGKKDCTRPTQIAKDYYVGKKSELGDENSEKNPSLARKKIRHIISTSNNIATSTGGATNENSLSPEEAQQILNAIDLSNFDKPVRFDPEWIHHQIFKSRFKELLANEGLEATPRWFNFVKDNFASHWCENPASRADKYKKQDWVSTWVNWVRRDLERYRLSWQKEQRERKFLQSDHAITPDQITKARSLGFDKTAASTEFSKMVAHYKSKGEGVADLDAAYEKWLLTAKPSAVPTASPSMPLRAEDGIDVKISNLRADLEHFRRNALALGYSSVEEWAKAEGQEQVLLRKRQELAELLGKTHNS